MSLTFKIKKKFYILLILFYSIGFSQLKPNQLRVNGRNILDSNGQVIRLVGINHGHAWYRGYLGSALQGIKSWGANSVRIVLSCGARWSEIPAHEVASIISISRELGFKAIVLEVHDTTGYGEQPGACDLQTAVNYWIKIKSVLNGHEDFVIINIGNEPWGNTNVSGWVSATVNAIQSMRNAGFTHLLMVDAPNWGQDWSNTMRNNAANILNQDPLRNVVFSVHMYEVYDTASKVQSYMSYFYNNNLPLAVGEFGHYHNNREVDEQAIVNYSRQYGFSIWGWSWCGNGGGYEYLDMVYSWDPNNPTNWGRWFRSNALTDLPQTYSLMITINPSGSGSVSLNPPGGSYTAGTQVTLTAQPNSGYVFSNWSGDLTGTQNPATITMNSNKNITANFVQSGGGSTTYTLTVNVSPSGSGVVYINPSQGSYTAGTQVTLTAQANSGYVFSGWSGDLTGTQNPATITMNSNKNITANFIQSGGGSTTYTLNVSVSPLGSGVVYINPSQGSYTAGTQVTLTAQPNSGYVFSNWSGDLTGTQNPATIIMNSNKNVTANFTQSGGNGVVTTYTLYIDVSPQNAGWVSVNPQGGVYQAGAQVTVEAFANSGYYFSGWSGDLTGTQNPATITINSNKTIVANFVSHNNNMFTLTIIINPQNSGIVRLNPTGGVYTPNTQVVLTAQPNSGYIFSSWSGDLMGTHNPATISMNSNKVVYANFTLESSNELNLNQNVTDDIHILSPDKNPFYLSKDGSIKLRYYIKKALPVKLNVYDINLNLVRTTAYIHKQPGENYFIFDGKDDEGNYLPTGIYLYQIISEDVRSKFNKIFIVR